jgi:hypothetical protein
VVGPGEASGAVLMSDPDIFATKMAADLKTLRHVTMVEIRSFTRTAHRVAV